MAQQTLREAQANETVDLQSSRMMHSALQRGWRVILTADHGNCDEMVDPQTGQPHTQHTSYPVPCLVAGEPDLELGIGRSLADVAPTILQLLGLPQPSVMTGRSLLINRENKRGEKLITRWEVGLR